MKKYLSAIEELKLAYPNLIYEDGLLTNAEEVIDENADDLINQYFEGFKVWDNDGSGNPEMDFERVSESGAEYVELTFGNDYEQAFNSIG